MFGRDRPDGDRRDGAGRSRAHPHAHGGDRVASHRGGGPYDLDDAPGDGVRRLDLGALLVPVLPRVDYWYRVDPSSDRVTAVVATAGTSTMEITVVAAPRTGGLWAEIQAEIRAEPEPDRSPDPEPGSESALALDQPASSGPAPGGPGVKARGARGPVRVLGVDGRRWFLQATVTGPAALDHHAEPALDDVLRLAIVLRGDRALPVRTPLPLRRPTDPDGIVLDRPDLDGLDPDAESRSGSGPGSDRLGRVRPTGAITGDARRVNLDVVTNPVARDG